MEKEKFFKYGKREIDYLCSKDETLGAVIKKIGFIKRPVIDDLFIALVHSISGQQISTAAHKTVWDRIISRFSPLTAESINFASEEELQSCGISMRKTAYIKEIAAAVMQGNLCLEEIAQLDDQQLKDMLCRLKGVGNWTAEMLMIFSLERPDVLSYDDFGIQKGLRMIYGHKELTKEQFEIYAQRYSPFGSVASLYIWAVAGGACPELKDPGTKK